MNLRINSQNNLYKPARICFKSSQITRKPETRPLVHERYFSIFESDKIKVISYQEPVQLREALQDILESNELDSGIAKEKSVIREFICNLPEEIKSIKVKGINGYGTSAIAFDTTDEKIIKITDGNHFPLNRPIQDFDVPIYKKGHNKNTYYYVQEKLYSHNLPKEFTQLTAEKIAKAGFKVVDLEDWASHQIGLSKEGKLYLLDSECAQYKNIFHAIFDKASRLLKRL